MRIPRSVLIVLGLALLVTIFISQLSAPARNSSSETSKITELGIQTVVSNLQAPWSLAFAQDGRLFITERPGMIKVWDGKTLQNVIADGLEVVATGEGGLLGITLDPNFSSNSLLYLYYTYRSNGELWNKVVKYRLIESQLKEPETLIDKIPAGFIHNGGRIKFGQDGMLYITTGDAGKSELSQDINSLAGKILRIKADGSIPLDNPFKNSPVYTLGHRNPQGIAWAPLTGRLFESEHGQIGRDEINAITKGANYGWPIISGEETKNGFVSPILESGQSTWAPAGISFCTCQMYPALKNSLLAATLRGEHLMVVQFDEDDPIKVKSAYTLLSNVLGRIRDVVEGPDGYIYLATSNRDGRGTPQEADDRVVRLVPLS
jgi:glucose/arabinose dehydrogenase